MALSLNLSHKTLSSSSSPPPRNKSRRNKNKRKRGTSKRKDKWNFKKKTILTYVIPIFIAVIASTTLFSLYKAKAFSEDVGISISPLDIIQDVVTEEEPELKKDSSGNFTNALIVGIDTRRYDESLQNTDTIILARFNHKTSETLMLSIPRDTFVEVPNQGWYTKINGIYYLSEQENEGSGMESLKSVVEDITGTEIQYYGMVDLQGFKEIINTIGGIDVYVPKAVIGNIPNGNPYTVYDTFVFEEGPQTMDAESALVYARFRYSPDESEASDFARAKRQHIVINAVKEKVLSNETLLNPDKIFEILNSLQGNVKLSKFEYDDIKAGLNILKEGRPTTYSFVLDPNFGGSYNIITDQGVTQDDAYALAPVLGIGNYSGVHNIIKLISTNPSFYEENAVINVYDTGIGYQNAYNKTLELQEKYPYNTILFMGTLYSDKVGTVVYDQFESEHSETVSELANYLQTTNNTQPEYIQNNLNGEDITILLGAEEIADSANLNE